MLEHADSLQVSFLCLSSLFFLPYFWLTSSVPGAAGGLASFLVSYQRGHYRHNKIPRKIMTEILGGGIVATAMAFLLLDYYQNMGWVIVSTFAVGTCWASLVQMIRSWITRVVKSIIGDPPNGGSDS